MSILSRPSLLPGIQDVFRRERLAALGAVLLDRSLAAVAFVIGTGSVLLSALCLASNDYDVYAVGTALALCIGLQILLVDVYRRQGRWDWRIGLLAVAALLGMMVLRRMPEYVSGWQLNGVFHRSLFSATVLFAVGLPAMSMALYHMLGATPHAEDLSRYPFILAPVFLAVATYLLLIGRLVDLGHHGLQWDLLRTPYQYHPVPKKDFIGDGWPRWTTEMVYTVGIRNHILGTGLLMLLTLLLSTPFGIAVGVFLSEYGTGRLAALVRFTVTALRSISLLILALFAYSLVAYSSNTPLAGIMHGTYFNGVEDVIAPGGSFLAASMVLALVVIPVIARSTEEGCRSLPSELREGSVGLGAPEAVTLRRLVLPWALPNVITGILLAAAEVAGSVAVLFFIGGKGEYGVGVFKEVTSLAFMIFDSRYGDKIYRGSMASLQHTAALLLLALTMGLGILASVTKRWLARRYRGG